MYLHPGTGIPPYDSESVQQTRDYLEACNLLFEQGMLSHKQIKDMQSEVISNIRNGFKFFTNWYDALENPNFHPVSSTERRFLAWQTMDLLRVMVFGFLLFCEDFFRRHPGYYLVPLKWNGSAVETLFSNLKRIAGGKLDSTNYATAREAYLAQRDTHGHRASKAARGYRDVPLYTRDGELTRHRR